MKKILVSLLPCVSLLVSAISFATNANALPVYKFNRTTKSWDSYQVDNMRKIDFIVTAGNYAWAVDMHNSTVAFYNRSNWEKAIKLPMYFLSDFYPAYPLSGKTSGAWIVDSSSAIKIAYLNGSNWNLIPSPFENQKEFNFAASGGYAWVVYSDSAANNNSSIRVKLIDSQNPTQWKEIPIPFESFAKIISINSFDDETGSLYILYAVNKDNINQKLLKVDVDGKWKIIRDFNNSTIDDDALHVKNKNVLTSAYDYSSNQGTDWIKFPSFANDIIHTDANMYNNIVCSKFISSSTRKFACLKTANPIWREMNANDITSASYSAIIDDEGAWVFSITGSDNLNDGNYLNVFRFNIDLEKVTDTKIPMHSNGLFKILDAGISIRAIGPNELLDCGYDEKNRLSVFHYINNEWQVTPLPKANFPKVCTFSTEGTPNVNAGNQNSMYYIPKGDIWLFPWSFLIKDNNNQKQFAGYKLKINKHG